MIKTRLKSILRDSKYFLHDECMINSLMRISCNNYEYCQYCHYNMHVTDNGYVCTQDIDVNEVR